MWIFGMTLVEVSTQLCHCFPQKRVQLNKLHFWAAHGSPDWKVTDVWGSLPLNQADKDVCLVRLAWHLNKVQTEAACVREAQCLLFMSSLLLKCQDLEWAVPLQQNCLDRQTPFKIFLLLEFWPYACSNETVSTLLPNAGLCWHNLPLILTQGRN